MSSSPACHSVSHFWQLVSSEFKEGSETSCWKGGGNGKGAQKGRKEPPADGIVYTPDWPIAGLLRVQRGLLHPPADGNRVRERAASRDRVTSGCLRPVERGQDRVHIQLAECSVCLRPPASVPHFCLPCPAACALRCSCARHTTPRPDTPPCVCACVCVAPDKARSLALSLALCPWALSLALCRSRPAGPGPCGVHP